MRPFLQPCGRLGILMMINDLRLSKWLTPDLIATPQKITSARPSALGW
jgi:hypothetical protein